MADKTTTIQIHEDVKARLLEVRTSEKESFNDVLRRLLDMNTPEKEPEYTSHVAHITAEPFYPIMNENLMKDIGKGDGDNITSKEVKINGVDTYVNIWYHLEIEVCAKTKDELKTKIEAIKDKLPEDNLEIKTFGQIPWKL